MRKNIFVFANEAQSGKSLVSLSLLRCLRHHFSKVGFFRPITVHGLHKQEDPHIQAAKAFFHIDADDDQLAGIDHHQIEEHVRHNTTQEAHQKIFSAYQALSHEYEVMICDSASLNQSLHHIELQLNLDIAVNLDCQILCVIHGHNKTLIEIGDQVLLMSQLLKQHQCDVMGMIINRVMPIQMPALKDHLATLPITYPLLGVIAENSKLNKPSIRDIQQLLQGEVLWGEDQLHRTAQQHIIAAKHPSTFLTVNYTKEESLVITPGDRQDILLSCILADQSKLYPNIGGIVLTTGIKPDPTIARIIDGLEHTPPIISTMHNTFEVAAKLFSAHYPTALFSQEKLDYGTEHVLKELDPTPFLERLNKPRKAKMTQFMLKHLLTQHAHQHPCHIVLPEGTDLRVLQAGIALHRHYGLTISLLGNIDTMQHMAGKHQLNTDDLHFITPNASPNFERYAKHLHKKRAHKNMTLAIAKDMLLNPNVFATCMVDIGDADGMVSGAAHTTSETIRPALQIIRAKPDVPTVASMFVMCMPNKVLIYADCAININPDAQQLAHIAMMAADMATHLQLAPRVAMLSYASGTSGTGTSVDKVRQATDIVKKARPGINIVGPIQYDAAVDPTVGQSKMPNCDIAGQANVLIFPDLDTGNNTYKAVQREARGLAVGPILLGLNKPVNDLSRGCTSSEIIMTSLITALQAYHVKHVQGNTPS